MPFIPLKKYVEDEEKNTSGYTINALRKLISRHWVDGRGIQWIQTPTKKLMVDPTAIKEWELSGN